MQKTIVERVIEHSMQCKNELVGKLNEREINLPEKIADDHVELRVNATEDAKTLLRDCMNTEPTLSNVYSDPLSSSVMGPEFRNVLTAQQQSINHLYQHIKQFLNAQ